MNRMQRRALSEARKSVLPMKESSDIEQLLDQSKIPYEVKDGIIHFPFVYGDSAALAKAASVHAELLDRYPEIGALKFSTEGAYFDPKGLENEELDPMLVTLGKKGGLVKNESTVEALNYDNIPREKWRHMTIGEFKSQVQREMAGRKVLFNEDKDLPDTLRAMYYDPTKTEWVLIGVYDGEINEGAIDTEGAAPPKPAPQKKGFLARLRGESDTKKYSAGDQVRINNYRSYDALGGDTAEGTVMFYWDDGRVAVDVDGGQSNVNPEDLELIPRLGESIKWEAEVDQTDLSQVSDEDLVALQQQLSGAAPAGTDPTVSTPSIDSPIQNDDPEKDQKLAAVTKALAQRGLTAQPATEGAPRLQPIDRGDRDWGHLTAPRSGPSLRADYPDEDDGEPRNLVLSMLDDGKDGKIWVAVETSSGPDLEKSFPDTKEGYEKAKEYANTLLMAVGYGESVKEGKRVTYDQWLDYLDDKYPFYVIEPSDFGGLDARVNGEVVSHYDDIEQKMEAGAVKNYRDLESWMGACEAKGYRVVSQGRAENTIFTAQMTKPNGAVIIKGTFGVTDSDGWVREDVGTASSSLGQLPGNAQVYGKSGTVPSGDGWLVKYQGKVYGPYGSRKSAEQKVATLGGGRIYAESKTEAMAAHKGDLSSWKAACQSYADEHDLDIEFRTSDGKSSGNAAPTGDVFAYVKGTSQYVGKWYVGNGYGEIKTEAAGDDWHYSQPKFPGESPESIAFRVKYQDFLHNLYDLLLAKGVTQGTIDRMGTAVKDQLFDYSGARGDGAFPDRYKATLLSAFKKLSSDSADEIIKATMTEAAGDDYAHFERAIRAGLKAHGVTSVSERHVSDLWSSDDTDDRVFYLVDEFGLSPGDAEDLIANATSEKSEGVNPSDPDFENAPTMWSSDKKFAIIHEVGFFMPCRMRDGAVEEYSEFDDLTRAIQWVKEKGGDFSEDDINEFSTLTEGVIRPYEDLAPIVTAAAKKNGTSEVTAAKALVVDGEISFSELGMWERGKRGVSESAPVRRALTETDHSTSALGRSLNENLRLLDESEVPARERQFVSYLRRGNVIQPTSPVEQMETIPAGVYKCYVDPMSGMACFERKGVNSDELLKFEDERYTSITNEIKEFWGLKESFGEVGLLHKRGLLMFGPPGSGKSCLIKQVTKEAVASDTIVLFPKSIRDTQRCLEHLRDVEPSRNVLVVLEDMDEYVQYEEHSVLELFDGDNVIDGVLYLGTSNYMERLPPRILRPGRFDTKVEVGLPPRAARVAYFNAKLSKKLSAEQIEEIVNATDDFSFAQMREMLAMTQVYKKSVADAAAKLRTAGAGGR